MVVKALQSLVPFFGYTMLFRVITGPIVHLTFAQVLKLLGIKHNQ